MACGILGTADNDDAACRTFTVDTTTAKTITFHVAATYTVGPTDYQVYSSYEVVVDVATTADSADRACSTNYDALNT